MSSLKHAHLFQQQLHDRGVPSVVSGGSNVLATEAGDQWLTLLEALEQPQRTGRIRSLGLTAFVGHSPAALDSGGDDLTDELAEQVRGWLDLFRSRGIAAVHESLVADGLAARVLARPQGERLLTDLDHLGQVLHEVSHREGLGLVALLDWLRTERRVADRSKERTRRLDTDATAVQLLTIHGSKGLQFPVVYLPLAFDCWPGNETEHLFHADDGRRTLDLGGGGDPARGGRREGRRGAAADLRRPDPCPVAGRHLVGAELVRRPCRHHPAPPRPERRRGPRAALDPGAGRRTSR